MSATISQATMSQKLPASSIARYGCYLGLATALVMLAYAVHMLGSASANPMPFKVAFLVAGAVQTALSVLALRRNRAAWAFGLSLNGTLAVAFLFGAPKVRDGLDLPMLLSLMPALVFALVTILLALGAEDY